MVIRGHEAWHEVLDSIGSGLSSKATSFIPKLNWPVRDTNLVEGTSPNIGWPLARLSWCLPPNQPHVTSLAADYVSIAHVILHLGP